VRNYNPTPWQLLSSLQAVLWAVLALCVGNAFGSLTLDPLDLPKADTADTARIREVAEAQSAQILALEEIGDSAEDCVGRELLTTDPMDQFWSPYSYVGGSPLMHVDPWGLEEAWNSSVEGGNIDLGSSNITAIAPVQSFSPDLTPTPIMPMTYDSKSAVTTFMNQLKSSKDVNTPRYESPAVGVIPQEGRRISQEEPDYVIFSLGKSIKVLSFSAALIRDKYGNIYFGGPISGGSVPLRQLGFSPVDASFVTGYFKIAPKNESAMRKALQGAGASGQVGIGFGAGKMVGSGGEESYFYGIMTPQIGAGTGWLRKLAGCRKESGRRLWQSLNLHTQREPYVHEEGTPCRAFRKPRICANPHPRGPGARLQEHGPRAVSVPG
jgi:hypothetical protein